MRSEQAALGRSNPTWVLAPPLLASALALAFPRPEMWLDEAATVSAASRSWGELWRLTEHQDRSLAGYYAATKALADLVGCDPLTAGRALSAGGYIAATLLVTLIAARLWGRGAGLVSGSALAMLPAAAASAVNARPEGISVFLIAAYLYAAMRSRRALQVICALLACSMYALNVLYLPLAALLPALARRRPTRTDVVLAGVVSVAGAGWLLACASQQKQVGWIHTNPGVDVVASFIRVGVSAPTSRTGETLVTSVSVALGVMLTLLTLSLIARRATRPNAAILLAMWVLPPLIVCAAVAAGKDIFVERYFTPSVIGMALMLGYGLTRTRVTPKARSIMGAVSVVACVPSFVSSHAPDGHWGENLSAHQREIRAAGPQRVAFAAPRNRAVLFAAGHLEPAWHDAPWWPQSKENGQLWGPPAPAPAPAPAPTSVVVVDTRTANKLTKIPGCTFAHRETLHREARFTTLGVSCIR